MRFKKFDLLEVARAGGERRGIPVGVGGEDGRGGWVGGVAGADGRGGGRPGRDFGLIVLRHTDSLFRHQ